MVALTPRPLSAAQRSRLVAMATNPMAGARALSIVQAHELGQRADRAIARAAVARYRAARAYWQAPAGADAAAALLVKHTKLAVIQAIVDHAANVSDDQGLAGTIARAVLAQHAHPDHPKIQQINNIADLLCERCGEIIDALPPDA